MLINLADQTEPQFITNLNNKFFRITKSIDSFRCGEFNEKCQKWTVSWENQNAETIQTEVFHFENPHLENGMNVIPTTIKGATGMLVDNYKPKLMTLPKLNTTQHKKLWKRLRNKKRIKHNVPIKEKGEVWVW